MDLRILGPWTKNMLSLQAGSAGGARGDAHTF